MPTTRTLIFGGVCACDCSDLNVCMLQALTSGSQLRDLTLQVVDLLTGEPKPRCQNCLFITQDATCLSDALSL